MTSRLQELNPSETFRYSPYVLLSIGQPFRTCTDVRIKDFDNEKDYVMDSKRVLSLTRSSSR